MQGDVPAEVRVDRPVRPLDPERAPVEYAEWLADKLHNTNDYGKEAAAALVKQAHQIESLRADLKAMEGFADLWYFVSDEAPLEFEKIVNDWSPGRWLGEAAKLRAAKRGA